MERAHSRLQSELDRYKDSNRTQEDLRENRLQVDQLQEQADRLTAELGSLQTAHSALRLLSLLFRVHSARCVCSCSSFLRHVGCEIDQCWEISDSTAATRHKIGLEHRSLLVLHKCAYFPGMRWFLSGCRPWSSRPS